MWLNIFLKVFETRHRTEENRLMLTSLVIVLSFLTSVCANSPPRFILEGGNAVGGDIIVRLKEWPDTPPGTKILQLRGHDSDGDVLTFGVRDQKDQNLIRDVIQTKVFIY